MSGTKQQAPRGAPEQESGQNPGRELHQELTREPLDFGQGQGALIYGKAGCPHTRRARLALPLAQFVDVLAEPAALEEMLRLSGGLRRIPVIAQGGLVSVGFKRGA